MVVSQNGWSANDRSKVSSRLVPGTTVKLTVRNGPAGDLLLEVASLFDRFVQDIGNARGAYNPAGVLDDWGYAERPIRGSATTSNHASGTAIDLNATRWVLGSSPSVNLGQGQIAKVREIVAAAGGAVRWGGDYTGRKDPMHFEVNTTSETRCASALATLRARYDGATDRIVTPPPAAPPSPREDEPMAILPIRTDAHGRFHETCMVEAGNSRYATQASITIGSTWGGTRLTLTALDHQGVVLYQWPQFDLADNAFAGVDLPPQARILTVEGYVEHAADVADEAGNITQPATRPAVAVLTKAA